MYKIHVTEENTLPPSRFSLIHSILGFVIIIHYSGQVPGHLYSTALRGATMS